MTNRENDGRARPLNAPTTLETLHVETGRYVRLLPSSSPLPVDERCEACDRSHDEGGHPVRTYHDAADVFDLCDDCALESASRASYDEGEDDVNADFVTFADAGGRVVDHRVTVTARGDDMTDVALGAIIDRAEEYPSARLTYARPDRAEVYDPASGTLWVYLRV